MKRTVLVGALVFVTMTACGTAGSSNSTATPTPTTTTAQTSSVATAAAPDPAPPQAAPESRAAETPEAVVPEEPVSSPIPGADITVNPDMPHGEQLYAETCQQFVTAIDALAATGAVGREQAATGISDRLQGNPSWSTLPADDQQQILRGLAAAGAGSC